jgi:hypothetical protein
MTADAKTPTPRTDAEFERNGVGKLCVFTDFARQLERELAASQSQLAELRRDAERYRHIREDVFQDHIEHHSWHWSTEVSANPNFTTPESFDDDVDMSLNMGALASGASGGGG